MHHAHYASQRCHLRAWLYVVTPLLLAMILLVVTFAAAAPGDLDPAFGENGIVRTIVGDLNDTAYDVVVQDDGTLTVLGHSSHVNGITVVALAQYDSQGSLDTSFGHQGFAIAHDGLYQTGAGLARRDDGKLVVAGAYGESSYWWGDGIHIHRYEANGLPDATFGVNGSIVTNLNGTIYTTDMVMQGDGKIVVLGTQNENWSNDELLLMRFNEDGSPDTTFGNDGQVTDADDRVDIRAGAVGMQSDGRLIVVGSDGSELALARYLSDGSLDSSFGLITTTVTPEYDTGTKIAFQDDGKIVVAGLAGQDVFVARFLDDGQLDTSFGTDGVALADFGGNEQANALLIQPDGSIVLVARTTGVVTVLRYTAGGTLDLTFGTDGIATTPLDESGRGHGLGLQDDGALIAVGSNLRDFAVLRYTATGTLDTSFGDDGFVQTDVPYGMDRVGGVVVADDGRIVLAGTSYNDQAQDINHPDDIFLAGHHSDGSLDDGFGDGGHITLDRGHDERAEAAQLQPDGKLLLSGSQLDSAFGGRGALLARYNTDGTLDTGFAQGGIATGYFASNYHDVVLQEDGKIVVAAAATGRPLARYNPDGYLDQTFGVGGVAMLNLDDATATDVVLTPEGNIIVAGWQSKSIPYSYDFKDLFLARFKSDGTLDTGFGVDGLLLLDYSGEDESDEVASLLAQPDGKVLLLHGLSLGTEAYVSRYNAGGTLDESFAVDGLFTTTALGAPGAMALQGDGKIIAAGNGSGDEFAILRLLTDGTLDPNFGPVMTPVGAGSMPADIAIQHDHKIVVAGVIDGATVLTRYDAGEVRVPPTAATVNGPTFGIVDTTYTFTVEVKPTNTLTPLTYSWQADGHTLVEHQTNDYTDAISFDWSAVGQKQVTVTVSNSEGSVTSNHTITVEPPPPPPAEVTIQGPSTGERMATHTFTATVSPTDVALPITYEWQATDQSTVNHIVESTTDTITFNWPLTGTKQIAVTATNAYGTLDDSHSMVVQANPALTYSTFLGGNSWESISDVATDDDGNTYVVGRTESVDFPLTAGAFDSDFQGLSEGFLAVFDPGGDLLYSSLLGGTYWDQIDAVAIRQNRYLYLFGSTQSPDFPTTADAYYDDFDGTIDLFIMQYDLEMHEPVFSTLLGGEGVEFADDMALAENGDIILTGWTRTPHYPTTPGAYDRVHGGGQCGPPGTPWLCEDVFVTRLAHDGGSLVYSTLLGGDSDDSNTTVFLDITGEVFVTGRTNSTDFPITPGALGADHNGGYDVFIAHLNASGSELLYGSYFGGSAWDEGRDIKVTPSKIVIGGATSSPDFPATAGSYDTSNAANDGFVMVITRDNSELSFATLVGGSHNDIIQNVLLDASGDIILAGYTSSSDYPVSPDAYDLTFNGGATDVFIAKLSAQGDALQYGSYVGGIDGDFPHALELIYPGQILIAGSTDSANYPVTPDAYDTNQNGNADGFLATIQIDPLTNLETATLTGPTIAQVDVSLTFTATVSPYLVAFPITYQWQATGQAPVTRVLYAHDDAITFSWNTPGAKEITLTAENRHGNIDVTYSVMVVDGEIGDVTVEEGGTLSHDGGDGVGTTVQIPAGAVTETTTLVFTPLEQIPPADDHLSTGIAFDLTAYRNGTSLADFAFQLPVTVTVQYGDQNIEGIDEEALKLYLQDGDAWIDAATTCSPPSTYVRDLEQNSLGVAICHLSRFALQGPASHSQLFLPSIMRH